MKGKLSLLLGAILSLIIFAALPAAAEDTAVITAPKTDNIGLYRDIQAYVSGENCYFFMPFSSDLSKITYSAGADKATLDLSEGKTAQISVNGVNYTASAYKSDLPVIYIEINEDYGTIADMHASKDHSAKCYGDMKIEVPEELAKKNGWQTEYVSIENKEKDPGTIEFRGRGNSSWMWSEGSARPYQVKLEKKQDIMGMGAAKAYTLLKADQLQTTAKFFLDMGRDMGVAFTPSAEFVTLYLNGEYRGMYTLSEKIEIHEERVNISNLEDEIDLAMETAGTTNVDDVLDQIDITGGYLLEIDNSSEPLQFKAQTNAITIKSPENLDDNVNAGSNYDYIIELMTDLFNAIYGDGYLKDDDYAGHPGYAGKHFTEVMDMDSVTRYFLEQELSSNSDNGLGSTFFYKDKDSIDGKIYMSPVWDNDRCGSITDEWVIPNKKYEDANHETHENGDKMETFFMMMCKHREFVSYVIAYYEDNINNNNIKKTFAEYESSHKGEEMGNAVLNDAKMTQLRWGYQWPLVPLNLQTFVTKRRAWIDANIQSLKDFCDRGEFITVENTVPKQDGKIDLNYSTSDGKININAKNDLGIRKNMDVYAAVFDESGKLTGVFVDKNVTVGDGEEYTKSFDYAGSVGTVKAMLWEKGKIAPIERVVRTE